MANEFTKPNSITPAVLGQLANPDDYNQNIAGQSKEAIVGIDADGSFADVDLGDESLVANGALIKNIKLREGYKLKFYNASGVFQNDVNLGQASPSLIGQVALATNAEAEAGTNTEKAVVPSNLKYLYGDTRILAWVRFDGTGTPSINDSYNVASISDLGTGRYRINYTNTLPHSNYAFFFSLGSLDTGNYNDMKVCTVKKDTTPQTTYIDIETFHGDDNNNEKRWSDMSEISVLIVG